MFVSQGKFFEEGIWHLVESVSMPIYLFNDIFLEKHHKPKFPWLLALVDLLFPTISLKVYHTQPSPKIIYKGHKFVAVMLR